MSDEPNGLQKIQEKINELTQIRDTAVAVARQAGVQIEFLTALQDTLLEFHAEMAAQEVELSTFREDLS